MNYKNKGFTLIELLVVIAIIGILASIVLVSLNGAKDRAKDVVIKSAIQEGAKIAEVLFDDNGSYNLICADPRLVPGGVIEDTISRNGGNFVCGDAVAGYCFSSTLNGGGSVCVDGYRELKYNFICSGAGDITCD